VPPRQTNILAPQHHTYWQSTNDPHHQAGTCTLINSDKPLHTPFSLDNRRHQSHAAVRPDMKKEIHLRNKAPRNNSGSAPLVHLRLRGQIQHLWAPIMPAQKRRPRAVDGPPRVRVPDNQALFQSLWLIQLASRNKSGLPKVRLVMLVETQRDRGRRLTVETRTAAPSHRDAFDCGRLDVSLSNRRASSGAKTTTLRGQGGMLLMWDRGLHSYVMVRATLARSCHYLGRVPANVKFEVELVLDDAHT
jgi:hypothetical protein